MSHQIVVCGAGIVGLSTALALARRGQRVAVLAPRASVPAADPDRYHPRVYAISPAASVSWPSWASGTPCPRPG